MAFLGSIGKFVANIAKTAIHDPIYAATLVTAGPVAAMVGQKIEHAVGIGRTKAPAVPAQIYEPTHQTQEVSQPYFSQQQAYGTQPFQDYGPMYANSPSSYYGEQPSWVYSTPSPVYSIQPSQRTQTGSPPWEDLILGLL